LVNQKPTGKVIPDGQLVVDAGDLLYIGPHVKQFSNADKAAAQERAFAIVDSFNAIGCDAFLVGEYDVVLGYERLAQLHRAAQFPWISANLRKKGQRAPLFDPFVVTQVAGMKVVIVGVTNNVGNRPRFYADAGFSVGDPARSLQAQAAAIKATNPDAVLLLSNLGIQGTTALIEKVGDTLPIQMALVSGSSRTTWNPVWAPGDVPIFEAGHRGKSLGRVDVHVVDGSFQFQPTSSPWTTTVRDYMGAYRSLSNARKAIYTNAQSKDEKRKDRIARNLQRTHERLRKIESGLPERIDPPPTTATDKSWFEPKMVQVKLSITQDKKVRRIIDKHEAKARKLEGRSRARKK
jgi:2',3'-cyclic-nucleotide 2'-phosphodiesterase (5'-nucleotidase family)